MTGLRRALLALGLAGLLAGLAAGALVISSDRSSPFWAVAAPLIAWSFIGTGLYAWWRRPENRFGAFMTAVGFAWLVAALMETDVPLLFVVSQAIGPLYVVLLAHMVLGFPFGRLRSQAERLLTATAYVLVLAGGIPYLLFTDFNKVYDWCDGSCPSNPILVTDDHDLAVVLSNVQNALGVLVVATFVVLVARRWRGATPPMRRTLAPVFATGGLTMALVTVGLVLSVAGVPSGGQDPVWIAALASFATVPFAFLFGLFRGRFARAGAVAALIGRLGEAPAPGRIRDLLAEGLSDPTLELAYWLPDSQTYVDSDGRPVELPGRRSRRRAWTAVTREGRPVAAILHDASLADQPELVAAAGGAAALALENERLEAELRARIEEVRASRARIVEAADDARRRLERNLHDGAQQRLVSLNLALKMARGRLESDPEGAGRLLDAAGDELGRALDDLRELARGIHPAVLSDRGLDPALETLTERSPVPVELHTCGGKRLPAAVEAAAYHVVAEALANIAKYSKASRATVEVSRRNGAAVVEVADDGVGGADPAAGTGLRGLQDRVAALDGKLRLLSPPGEGTIIRAEIPCA